MRTLTAAFTAAQQAANLRVPLVKLEVATYAHPAITADTVLQWSDFAWELLVSDATSLGTHSVAMPADGSLCRVRSDGVHQKYQRVTTPSAGDDWTTWADWGDGPSYAPITLAALGTEVIAFCHDGVNLYYKKSTDSGATFGAWTVMANARPCERGVAAAFKANGDVAVVHASDVNDPTSLYIQKRVGGAWSAGLGQISGDHAVSALAMYHDGDWNILVLLLDGSYIRLARGIYGDGHDYAAGTWSGWTYINSYKARVDYSAAMHLRQFHTGRAGRYTPTYYEQFSAVQEQRAADNLSVDDPYITYHASLGAVFSFSKDNAPWFYRLAPGTAFKDDDWSRAWQLDTTATRGLALCCDGTYLYATAPNVVWRTLLPGNWTPPTAGAGAGTYYEVPVTDIYRISEQVRPLSTSSLTVLLNNRLGLYDSPGGGDANYAGATRRGSILRLSIGYAGPLLSVAGYYFIEELEYTRSPGKRLFAIHAIDAWGLLEKFGFTRPVEWNAVSDDETVYDLIELVIKSVGGSIAYVSRSSEILATYPHITVSPGENAASVLRRLLDLVPDVIYFIGLTGYIVYPQATDTFSYFLSFPSGVP